MSTRPTQPQDTIAAIATATGGAVGIVRLSGPRAVEIVAGCISGWPDTPRSHHLYYGHLLQSGSGELVDEVLAVVMRGPRSFTGEDVAEIHCHGGTLNLRRALEAVLKAGARQAEAGEFSLRAFLNGRLDLTQAEAIVDVVNAESDEALRVAQAQLGGSLRVPVEQLRNSLLDLVTLLEAALDFAAEEHVYQLPTDDALARIDTIASAIRRMLAAKQLGEGALGGVRMVLVGEPNVGKSSLFNRLVGREQAIVTEVPGTTRDVLEAPTAFFGHRIQLVDTAGLRHTDDVVEQIGVDRTHEQLAIADLVVWVVDAAAQSIPPLPMVADAIAEDRLICAVNKVDRLAGSEAGGARRQRSEVLAAVRERLPEPAPSYMISTSAATGEGIAILEDAIAMGAARMRARSDSDVPMVTSIRHATALESALEALERGRDSLAGGMPLELAATDARDAADALGEIVGAIATDEVLGRIFAEFCVGK